MTSPEEIARLRKQLAEMELQRDEARAQAESYQVQLDDRNLVHDSRQSSSNGGQQSVENVSANAVYKVPKIPPFLQADPALWFVQVEASFRHAAISVDTTKVDFLITSLDGDAMTCVRDLLIAERRAPNLYQLIKDRIISTFALSDESKLRKLIKGQVLNDGKPSLMLSRLKSLSVGVGDTAIIRSVFLDQLPPDHRNILIATGATDLDKLAEAADRLAEGSSDQHRIFAVSKQAAPWEAAVQRLEAKVDSLFKKINNFDRNRPQSRGRQGKPQSGPRQSIACRHHARHPDNPSDCKKGCPLHAEWLAKNA